MKVIIDTNIFVGNYHMDKPHFKVFLDGHSAIPAKLYMPKVVREELINRYSEDLFTAGIEFNNAQKKLAGLRKTRTRPFKGHDKAVVSYTNFLDEIIEKYNFEIVEFPDIPHEKLVAKDLKRQKPFKRSGEGYRDALLWENVKRIMMWGEERVVFITNNTSDFGEGPLVHPDLQTEINNPSRLTLIRSLHQFNETYILPILKKLDEIKVLLQKEQLEDFDIREWLNKNLLDVMYNYELEEVFAGFPPGVGSARATEIIEFKEIEIKDVSEIGDGDKLITVYIVFDASISIDSDWDDYINHQEVRDFWGTSEQFSWATTTMPQTIISTVDLIIDAVTKNVDSEEIIEIAGDYNWIEFGRW